MENSHTPTKAHKSSNIWIFCVIIATIIVLIALINILLSESVEYTKSDSGDDLNSSLSCSADNLSESFFDLSQANNTTQEIKIAFHNDKLNTIMYTLAADYGDSGIAQSKEADLHAQYNNYMVNHDMSIETISNDFSSSNSRVRVKLYAEKRDLGAIIATLFMLAPSDYSSTTMQNYYEDKGFICNYKD